MTLIVSVDGGASRCRLAAFSLDGKVLARATVEQHASLSLGAQPAWQHIELGLQVIRRSLGMEVSWQPSVLSMGLAGSLQQERRQEFLSLIPTSLNVLLYTDGFAQLMGASDGDPGICLAVGTGSVMHWLDHSGKEHMAGGWGFPAGDEASGAWFGLRLLQVYIRHREVSSLKLTSAAVAPSDDSVLISELESRIGTSASEVQQWTTQTRSSVLAQLAPLVFDAASAGDSLAVALVNEGVEHCMRLIRLAPSNLPVFVMGGVGTQLSEPISQILGERYQRSKGDALYGLWRLSLAA